MVSVGRRVTRAFLIGISLGLIAGLGFYFMATAINMIAMTTVFDPIALLVLTMGAMIVLAIGIELSADLAATAKLEATK